VKPAGTHCLGPSCWLNGDACCCCECTSCEFSDVAVIDALVRIIKQAEWAGTSFPRSACPWCGAVKDSSGRHDAECVMVGALRFAGHTAGEQKV